MAEGLIPCNLVDASMVVEGIIVPQDFISTEFRKVLL